MHASPRHHAHAAYTLIELLVVISIIVVLAGLLVPVTGVVRRMMNDMKCGHHLQQIGAAIEAYKFNNNDRFPDRLFSNGNLTLGDLFHSDGPLKGLNKILLCPRDAQLGKDPKMGRPTSFGDLSYIYTTGSSYLYEMSSLPIPTSYVKSFYRDRGEAPNVTAEELTWAAAKHNQIKFGNVTDDSNQNNVKYGASFPPSYFPILRCYWHHKWKGVPSQDAVHKKVKNISWDLNVFDSSPYWENDVNSLNKIPPD
jgi:prepilin-type N-terminal cleavage/methylation domain-containing protein